MTPRQSITGQFGVSVASILVATIFVAYALVSMISTAALAATMTDKQPLSTDAMMSRHQKLLARYQEEWGSRALFGKLPRVTTMVVIPPELQPESTPSRVVNRHTDQYTGPNLIALVGAKAWFKPPVTAGHALRLSVGQELAGVTLLSVDAPWTARVRYQDREWTLTLFDEHRVDRNLLPSNDLDVASKGLMDRSATLMMDDDLFGDQGRHP